MNGRFFFLLILFFISLNAVADDDLIFIGIRSALLKEIVLKPVTKTTGIDKTQDGVKMLGAAVTKGDIQLVPFESYDGIGFTVRVDTTTTSNSQNSKGVGRTITSHFPWTVTTTALTTKNFLLRENGVAHYQAATLSCVSSVAFEGVEAEAFSRAHLHNRPIMEALAERRPLIRRLRERPLIQGFKEAVVERGTEKMLPKKKAEIEDGFNKEVFKTVIDSVNSDAYDYVYPYHVNYYQYVYEPFIVNELLGGRFTFGSSADWLVLKGIRGKDPKPVVARAEPALQTRQNPIFMSFHQEFFERFLEMRFGETEITEVEGLELLGRKVPPQKTLEDVLGNEAEEVTLVFHAEKPIKFNFHDDQMDLTFRFREMTAIGKTLNDVQLTRVIRIDKTGGKLLLIQEPPKQITTFDGKPIDKSVEKHVLDRFKKILPAEPTDLAKAVLFAAFRPMAIKDLSAKGGQVSLDLDFVRK